MEFHDFQILQIAKGGPYDYFQNAKGGPYDSCKIVIQEHPIFLDFHQNVKGGTLWKFRISESGSSRLFN